MPQENPQISYLCPVLEPFNLAMAFAIIHPGVTSALLGRTGNSPLN
jgi:hypothetical protein